MKSVIFLALFTLFLMDVSILPVYLVPIWDGTRVKTMESYPYMCGIVRNLSDEFHNLPCGCSIISPNFALTAADCFDDERDPSSAYTFFAGSVNFKEGQTRQIFQKTDVIIHPSFNINGIFPLPHFNLAIIKLNPPLKFTDNVKSVRLASRKDCTVQVGRDYVITGWGSNGTDGKLYTENLLRGIAKPVKRTRCAELYKLRGYDHEKHICTTKPSGACVGDYGGPLAFRESNGFVLCGVIAHGDIWCHIKNTIYTRVFYFKQWICENTYNEPAGCLLKESAGNQLV